MDSIDPRGEGLDAKAYETALIECAAGRSEAIARIYAAERRNLSAAARRLVLHHDRAEDVIHDAFVQILRDAKSFDPARGSARAWVYAIVRNTALKSRWKAGRETATADAQLFSAIDGAAPNVDGRQGPVDGFDLRALLEALEPRRRACLIMAIIDGRTHAEIATYLGVPIGTVKSWIRRELIALRKQLG